MENKRDKFKRLAELRVNNLLKNIKLVGNLANRKNYLYDDNDVKKIFRTIKKELDRVEKLFGEVDQEKFKL